MKGNLISSCDGQTNAPPATNAIRANSGGIISKLSEWSGGDKITGNAVGNRITGFAEQQAGTGKDWCAKCGEGFWNTCGPEECVVLSKQQINEEGKKGKCAYSTNKCTFVDYAADMCKKCGDVNLGYCTQDYCENTLSKYQAPLGTCKFTDGTLTSNDCTPEQTDAQKKEAEDYLKKAQATEAEKTVADNKGRAIAFGKTAVVCGKGGIASDLKCCMNKVTRVPTYYTYADKTCPDLSPYGTSKEVDLKICDASIPNEKPGNIAQSTLVCKVKAFELPQDVDSDIKIIGGIKDFVTAWMGAYGEPKYLVYYETFPTGIEGIWTYDEMDVILTSVAIGGILNIGGGGAKAIWAGAKTAGTKTVISIARREGFSEALSSGKKAFMDKLAIEYGAESTLRAILRKSVVKAFHGEPQINAITEDVVATAIELYSKDVEKKGKAEAVRNMYNFIGNLDRATAINFEGGTEMQKAFLKEVGFAVAGKEENAVFKESLREMGVMQAGVGMSEDEFNKKTDQIIKEIEGMRQEGDEGKLIAEKSPLRQKVAAKVRQAAEKSYGIRELVERSATQGVGKYASIKKLLKTKAWKKEYEWQMKKVVAEDTDDVIRDLVSKEQTLKKLGCNEKCYGDYIDEVYGSTYNKLMSGDEALYTSAYDKLKAGEYKDAFKDVAQDAGDMISGFAGVKPGSVFTLDRQKKVMAVSFAISYFAMMQDANIEKYESCGQGKVCLHVPTSLVIGRDIGNGTTYPYGDGSEVMKNYNDLVSLAGFTGGATLRMHLMSPCKADLEVKADASGGCRCETFYGKDTIAYRLDRVLCIADFDRDGDFNALGEIGSWDQYVDLTDPGVCPQILEVKTPITVYGSGGIARTYSGSYNVKTEVQDATGYNNVLGKLTFGPFEDCKVTTGKDIYETLQECVYKKMHMERCTDSNPDDNFDPCLKDEYRQCFSGAYFTNDNKCLKSDVVQYEESNPFYNRNGQLLDFVPVSLNTLPNVDKTKPSETVSVCESSWVAEKLSSGWPTKCITVTPNPDSIKTYEANGFGSNFCAENKESLASKVEESCFYGAIAVTGALELASCTTGIGCAALAAAPVITGAAGTVCEKLVQMETKWPQSQY